MPRAQRMAAYVRDGYETFLQPIFECGSSEMLAFGVYSVRPNLYVFSLYLNRDQDMTAFITAH